MACMPVFGESAKLIPFMSEIDPVIIQRRLAENYSHMTEDELAALAEKAYDLVPVAKEALQAVISERGLKIRLATAPPAQSPSFDDTSDEDDKLTTVRQLSSELEAKQAKAILDANFIAS